jgi:hypothetical protein
MTRKFEKSFVSARNIECLLVLDELFDSGFYKVHGTLVEQVVDILLKEDNYNEGGEIAGRYFDFPEIADKARDVARDLCRIFSEDFWQERVQDILLSSETVQLDLSDGSVAYVNGSVVLVSGHDEGEWSINLMGEDSPQGVVTLSSVFGVQIREVLGVGTIDQKRKVKVTQLEPSGFAMRLYEDLIRVRRDGLLRRRILTREMRRRCFATLIEALDGMGITEEAIRLLILRRALNPDECLV